MRITFEKRVLLIIAGCVTVALTIVIFVIIPFVRKIQNLNQQTYDLRVYLEKKHHRAVDFNLAVKTLGKVAPQTVDFPKHVYSTADALKLITSLESIASQNQVAQKINSSNLDSNSQLVTISLQVSGTYQNVLSYIRSIETLDYFLIIRSIQLSGSVNNIDKSQTVIGTLDMSLYAN